MPRFVFYEGHDLVNASRANKTSYQEGRRTQNRV